jgi:GT2 family glycosyltransferase
VSTVCTLRTAVVTIAHGRHEHLRGQGWGLLRQTRPADLYVVVEMGDPDIPAVAREQHPDVITVELPANATDLPLARARTAGARAAVDAGADVLVFLDVDCIPEASAVERYAEVLSTARSAGPVVACGEVRYLPAVDHPADYRVAGLADRAEPHPARPAPARGAVVPADDMRLFWSLSFAVTATDWQTLEGFDETYVGYGAEETDFGQRLAAARGALLWVGGATAYHQHHASEVPPIQHLESIVRNANLFRDRWDWFPMDGWLAAFEARGLARLDEVTGRWRVTETTTQPTMPS